jgi:hypothetical protein
MEEVKEEITKQKCMTDEQRQREREVCKGKVREFYPDN